MASTVEVPHASTASSDVPPHAPTPHSHHSRVRPSRRPGSYAAGAYLAPALILYAGFTLWPLGQLGWLSLNRWDGYGSQTWIGLSNFMTLLTDPIFQTTLEHSIVWDICGGIVPTVLTLGLALLVRQSRARFAPIALLFIPVLLPATVVAALWVMIYSPVTGLLNTVLQSVGLNGLTQDWLGDPHVAPIALFVAWLWSVVGVGTLIFWSGLGSIDQEYYLLARSEGAGPLWRMRHVTLPGISRIGAVALLVNAALAAQVFDLVFVTTGGGPGYSTMLLPIDSYGRAFGGFTGQGAAVACLQVGIGLLLAIAALQVLRSDVTLALGTPESAAPGRRRLPSSLLLWCLVVLMLLPIAWLSVATVEPGRTFALQGALHVDGFESWTGENIVTAWTSGMAGALATSAWFACIVLAATVLLAAPAAFSLNYLVRSRFLKGAIFVALVLGLLQPLPILIIPLFTLVRDLGFSDTTWGIVLPEIAQALPFSILLLYGTFRGQPVEIAQAALVDGATSFQRMFHVALPLARPALFAAGIWAFITSWNQYLLPTVVSQDGSLQTVPTILATFVGRYDTAYGPLAAGTALAIVPVVILVIAQTSVVARHRRAA